MTARLQNSFDRSNHATDDTEPDYICIHSVTEMQTAKWDDWAIQAAEMLERHGWVKRRIGDGVHLQHPVLIRGIA